MIRLVIIIFLTFSFLKVRCQKLRDTTTIRFINLYHNGFATYTKAYNVNDSMQVEQVFIGKSYDTGSFSLWYIDTSIIYSDTRKKIFDGRVYDLFSISKFNQKVETKELLRSGNDAFQNYFIYAPSEKINISGEDIYVYDRIFTKGKRGQGKSPITRVYFSYKNGIIGYFSLQEKMLRESFVNKLEMQLPRLFTKPNIK